MIPKFRLAAVLAGVLVMASAARTPALAAQTSYPLICRGGPTLRLSVEMAAEVAAGATRLGLRFARASHGAVGGVEPGTCAWQDRGVRDSEPAVLCLGPAQNLGFQMAAGREMAWIRARVTVGGTPLIFWEGGERPDGAAYQPSNAGELQYYRARHDPSRACLAVTQLGP